MPVQQRGAHQVHTGDTVTPTYGLQVCRVKGQTGALTDHTGLQLTPDRPFRVRVRRPEVFGMATASPCCVGSGECALPARRFIRVHARALHVARFRRPAFFRAGFPAAAFACVSSFIPLSPAVALCLLVCCTGTGHAVALAHASHTRAVPECRPMPQAAAFLTSPASLTRPMRPGDDLWLCPAPVARRVPHLLAWCDAQGAMPRMRADQPAPAPSQVRRDARIIIVGAGPGLAARLLSDRGLRPRVPEARPDRVGGRIHTIDMGGSPVDQRNYVRLRRHLQSRLPIAAALGVNVDQTNGGYSGGWGVDAPWYDEMTGRAVSKATVERVYACVTSAKALMDLTPLPTLRKWGRHKGNFRLKGPASSVDGAAVGAAAKGRPPSQAVTAVSRQPPQPSAAAPAAAEHSSAAASSSSPAPRSRAPGMRAGTRAAEAATASVLSTEDGAVQREDALSRRPAVALALEPKAAVVGQCEKDPRCTRGPRHMGHGGRCSYRVSMDSREAFGAADAKAADAKAADASAANAAVLGRVPSEEDEADDVLLITNYAPVPPLAHGPQPETKPSPAQPSPAQPNPAQPSPAQPSPKQAGNMSSKESDAGSEGGGSSSSAPTDTGSNFT